MTSIDPVPKKQLVVILFDVWSSGAIEGEFVAEPDLLLRAYGVDFDDAIYRWAGATEHQRGMAWHQDLDTSKWTYDDAPVYDNKEEAFAAFEAMKEKHGIRD